MDIRELCLKTYQEYVASRSMNSELRRALKTHERVPAFVDNLARQFQKVPFSISRDTVIKSVRSLTDFFIHAVETQSRERVMSDVAKLTLKAEHEAKKAFKREADLLLEKGGDHANKEEKENASRAYPGAIEVPEGIL